MKILFLVTHTENCEPFWRSLEAIGHEVVVERYDDRPHNRHDELVVLAHKLLPDYICYIGAYEPSHGAPVLQIATLCKLAEAAPLILLCGDAADDPWWPVLDEYRRAGCFTRVVSIDGTLIRSWPAALVALTPVDPRPFVPLAWDDRTVRLGMVGGAGHRANMINTLTERGLLTFSQGPQGRSYAEFAALMCRTKVTLNLGQTGTGRYLHVKGRVVEAGFAGCCLLEPRSSPTETWFTPGVDYLEYETAEDVAQIMVLDEQVLAKAAANLHKRVTTEHHPRVFWEKILA